MAWVTRVLWLFFIGSVFGRYSAPELCTWDTVNNDTTKLAVTCRLRTLLSESSTISAIQTEGTTRLNIECNEMLFSESILAPKTFHTLHQLDTLSVSNCKILEIPVDAFDGLRDLKRLSIHTRNKDWSSMKSMELVPGSFDGLKELQSLNLSDSNIQSIPEDVFCSLVNLQSLNLSRNGLRSMESLGLIARRTSSDPDQSNSRIECSGGADIKTLDLSSNHFRTLQQYSGLTKLRRLQNLYLQDNEFNDIAPDSLMFLSSLRVLNLSNNHLEMLPETLFSNSKEIREIYLQNNGLYQLPKRLFNRLEQLVILNLSNNKISQIDDDPFVGLIRLVVLDLSRNALTHIKSKFFKDLLVLQILDLHNNSIGFIEDNAFLPLYNLHTLNLAENRLHQVSASLFNGLFVLSKLILSNNFIVNVNTQAFKNCSALKELDLSSNAITEVPVALTELSFLRTLDLGENQITTLRNGSFKNMESLTGLRLVDNGIGNLTDGMFWDLPNLQVLNLSKNKVQQISHGTFSRNVQLQAIRLDANFLTDINGVFVSLANLLWLNLSNNHLVWFDYAMVPRSLKWLDIHGNYIENLANYYGLQEDLNIRTLDASHNRITEISDLSIPNSVELVFINNNFISNVKVNSFFEKSNLARVDMYANEITKLDINALRLSPVPANRSLPEFYIGGNPFECDCTMDWLPVINNMTQLRQHPKVMDLENVMCKISHSRGTQLVSAISVPPNQFLCRYETHCFTVCKCCDFDACDCEMTCPTNCSCYHDQTWNTNVVDCSRQRSLQVPSRIPMDATHVYLDGNDFGDLQDHVFIGRKNMVTLFLNESKILSVQNYTFNGLNALQVLHLEDNQISELKGFEFEQLTFLKELYLQNNRLLYISNLTFQPLRFLQILRLDGNKLVDFPVWQLQVNSYLVEVMLGNNQWQCKCAFSQEFRTWISDNRYKVLDHRDISCYVDGHSRTIDVNSTVCSDYFSSSWVFHSLVVSDYFPVIVLLFATLVIFLVILIVMFVFRDPMRIWLYTRYGIRVFQFKASTAKHFEEDREKLFDGYVVYSPKDEEFVLQSIVAELEHGSPPYHLCLHYRDLPHHGVTSPSPYLQHGAATVVVEAAAASRRVILVLSRNFLQTEWSRYEFRSALHEALRGRMFKLVLVEDGAILPEAELDSELRPYLKTNARVRWGEKRFWERLRCLMPRDCNKKTCNLKRNVNNYTLESMSSVRCQNGSSHHPRSYPPPPQPPSPPPPSSVHQHININNHNVFKASAPPEYTVSRTNKIQNNSSSGSAGSCSQEEANYSSATTATPSPRPHHRQVYPPTSDRPNSDHIYSSIDTPEYLPSFERTGSRRLINENPALHHQNWRNSPSAVVDASGVQAYLV